MIYTTSCQFPYRLFLVLARATKSSRGRRAMKSMKKSVLVSEPMINRCSVYDPNTKQDNGGDCEMASATVIMVVHSELSS